MNIASILGIVFGFGFILLGYKLEGGHILDLIFLSPAVIVFGGTVGAILLSYDMKHIKKIPSLFLGVLKRNKSSVPELIDTVVELSEVSKRDGFLKLEEVLESEEMKEKVHPSLKRGLLLVVDGTDLEEIQDLLETEMYLCEKEIKTNAGIFEALGGLSPTMGVIGTVMGLIHALGSASSDPADLVASIAVAFIATLYGVLFANLLYLPVGSKIKIQGADKIKEMELIIDGISSIRNGENPKVLRDRLSIYLGSEAPKNKKEKKSNQEG